VNASAAIEAELDRLQTVKDFTEDVGSDRVDRHLRRSRSHIDVAIAHLQLAKVYFDRADSAKACLEAAEAIARRGSR
jgi:hypothetical protein